jgi:hypothetical protein
VIATRGQLRRVVMDPATTPVIDPVVEPEEQLAITRQDVKVLPPVNLHRPGR